MKAPFLFLAVSLFLNWTLDARALAGTLAHPGLSLPQELDTQYRSQIQEVLASKDAKFISGRFVNAFTTLEYGGGMEGLNGFLKGLAACPGLRIQVLFRETVGSASWIVQHNSWADPFLVTILINLQAPALELKHLEIPPIQGALPSDNPQPAEAPVGEKPPTR